LLLVNELLGKYRLHPEPTVGKLLVKDVRKYFKDEGVEDA